jgi:hypothetical protein
MNQLTLIFKKNYINSIVYIVLYMDYIRERLGKNRLEIYRLYSLNTSIKDALDDYLESRDL